MGFITISSSKIYLRKVSQRLIIENFVPRKFLAIQYSTILSYATLHLYSYIFFHYIVDPPAITTVKVTGRCTNDFTVSWTAASNEEGLSYTVSLLLTGMAVDPVVDTSYNFTELMPNITYTVSIVSRLGNTLITPCLGIPYTTMVTTLTVEAGVPQSELIVMYCTFEVSVLN